MSSFHEGAASIDDFVESIASSADAAAFQIAGRIGTGKTTVLRELAQRLDACDRGICPIVLSPLSRQPDTGPSALAQLVDGLKLHGFVNGESQKIADLNVSLDSKLAMVAHCANSNREKLVILCDDPGEWQKPATEYGDDQYTERRKQQVTETILGLRCRRVFAGYIPWNELALQVNQFPVSRFANPAVESWGAPPEVGAALDLRIGSRLAGATTLERRLVTLLARITTPEAACDFFEESQDVWTLARRLAECVNETPALTGIRDIWAKLALLRGPAPLSLMQPHGSADAGYNTTIALGRRTLAIDERRLRAPRRPTLRSRLFEIVVAGVRRGCPSGVRGTLP